MSEVWATMERPYVLKNVKTGDVIDPLSFMVPEVAAALNGEFEERGEDARWVPLHEVTNGGDADYYAALWADKN